MDELQRGIHGLVLTRIWKRFKAHVCGLEEAGTDTKRQQVTVLSVLRNKDGERSGGENNHIVVCLVAHLQLTTEEKDLRYSPLQQNIALYAWEGGARRA